MANDALTQPVEQTLTEQVVARVRAIEDLPADVAAAAIHCILDTLGVAIAGSREPVSTLVRARVLKDGGSEQAGIWGTRRSVSRTQAALVNGTAAHALDFDDVSAAMEGHPSAPLLPALLAAAEGEDITGRDLLKAFVIGFETEALIGRLMSPSHYARGFHTTATVGAFGAAAASAQILGLGEREWLHAFGIAGAAASGLKSMFGTMTKPLQVGAAAESGLRASVLAQDGVTANQDVLGAEQGFRDTQSTEVRSLPAPVEGAFAIRDVLFKYHAACYLTHSAIEGLLSIREAGVTAESVRSVVIEVPPGHLRVCNIQTPTTPLEGKFSLRFVSALTLIRGDVSEGAFDEEALVDPQLTGFLDRVSVKARVDDHRSSIVTVTCTDATEHRAEVNVNEPTPPDELDRRWAGLVRKFHSLTDPVVGVDAAAQIVSVVEGLDTAPGVSQLWAALAGAVQVGPD